VARYLFCSLWHRSSAVGRGRGVLVLKRGVVWADQEMYYCNDCNDCNATFCKAS
jgi:hypothetical protein